MADVLVCTPPSGSLRDIQWNSASIRELCEDVLRGQYRDTKTPPVKRASASELDNAQSLRSSVELSTVSKKQTARSISPGLRDAVKRGVYFVRPDWDAIESQDPDYETTLQARRHKGDVLYRLQPRHASLRDGCEFIVSDPKWLLSRFFADIGTHSLELREVQLPWYVRSAEDARLFWSVLRNVEPEEVDSFECQCVIELLKHVGACFALSHTEPIQVCFPVMAYKYAPELASTGYEQRASDFIALRKYNTADERDAFAFLLTRELLKLNTAGRMQYEFFRQHLIVKVDNEGSILIHMFDSDKDSGAHRVSVWKHWNFPQPKSLLQRLLVQLEGMPVIGSTSVLFGKEREQVCDCVERDECALCIFGDVTRALFLGPYADKGFHTDVELVQRAVQFSQK